MLYKLGLGRVAHTKEGVGAIATPASPSWVASWSAGLGRSRELLARYHGPGRVYPKCKIYPLIL